MKIIFFSSKAYDKEFFCLANKNFEHDIRFVDAKLTSDTVRLIKNETVVCVFVNDVLDREVLTLLSKQNIKLIALRCAGFNNVDISLATELGINVVRVPAYSPSSVAEHTVCLMLSLNRKVYRAYNRVRDGNFSLNGLLGFDFSGKTLGIVGAGNIGTIVARIMGAMGMKVLVYDPVQHQECHACGVEYVGIDQLFRKSDVISLHCPLNAGTRHIVNQSALAKMKQGVMLVNTGRGALLDTSAVIQGLKSKKIGYLGLDVYEQESDLFFQDLSCEIIQDDVFERLLTFPNVLITAHQGFFTSNAMQNIAETTLNSILKISEDAELPSDVLVTAS